MDRVFLAAPKLAELRYAFDTGQFVDAQGQEVSDAELATLARETAQAREAGVGLAAAKTAIATASLLQGPEQFMAAEHLLLGGRKLAAKGAVLKSQGTLPDAPGTATPSGPQGAAQALNRIMVRHFQDPSWENAYVQVELPDALSGLQQAIEHGFAKSLIGVRGTTPAARSLNGINTAGRLFVNVEANVGFLNVAGHELFHQLKKDRPDLYQWFAGQARSHYQHLPAYKAKLDALLQPGETPYSREAAEEELLADRVVVAPAGFSP